MGADPGKGALKNSGVLKSLPEEIGEGAIACMSQMTVPLDVKNMKNKLVPIKCI